MRLIPDWQQKRVVGEDGTKGKAEKYKKLMAKTERNRHRECGQNIEYLEKESGIGTDIIE